MRIAEQIDEDSYGALRRAGFRLLLEKGRPITIQEWADAAGVPDETVVTLIDDQPGRVELDAEKCLVGLAGLSVTPGRHELQIEDQVRWTWCALDAVGIMGALGASGVIRSTDPHTGDLIEISVTGGQLEGNAAIFIANAYGGNVRQAWCPLVNLFTSQTSAEAWAADNDTDGDIFGVADISENSAELWRPLIDPPDFS